MNRIDRLFAILLQLQARKQTRIKDLSRAFEVSERTIYRDITALSEMGVPVHTQWGEGVELLDGYYLPPLLFTREEAVFLVLGAKMLARHVDGHATKLTEQAMAKIASSLPKHIRTQVEQQSSLIEFFAPQYRFNLNDRTIMTLQEAILRQQLVEIHYHSHSKNEKTTREIEAYSLMYSEGIWYLNAYCRLRESFRVFRVNRINKLRLLSEHFAPRPVDAEIQQIVEVRVRFEKTSIQWVRERQHYSFQGQVMDEASQDLVMIYHPNTFAELKPWLLSWGASAEILSPLEFRDQLREEAIRLVKVLT